MEGESGDENLLKHERKGFSPLLEEETTDELTHTWPRWGHGNFFPSFDVGGWFCSEWDSPILFSSQQFFLPGQYTMGRSFLSFLSFFRSGSGGEGEGEKPTSVSSLFGRRGCQEGDRGGGGEDFIRGDGTEGFLSLSAAHSCKVVHTFFFPFHGNREGYRAVVPARTLNLFVLLDTVKDVFELLHHGQLALYYNSGTSSSS